MWRQARSSTVEREWLAVSRGQPCPICGAQTGCSVAPDEEFVCCMSSPSEWPVITGGWLHRTPATIGLPRLN